MFNQERTTHTPSHRTLARISPALPVAHNAHSLTLYTSLPRFVARASTPAQSFPWVKGWNGAIGWGHMASTDLVHWKEISSYTGMVDAFVPGRWHDPEYGVPSGGECCCCMHCTAVLPAACARGRRWVWIMPTTGNLATGTRH